MAAGRGDHFGGARHHGDGHLTACSRLGDACGRRWTCREGDLPAAGLHCACCLRPADLGTGATVSGGREERVVLGFFKGDGPDRVLENNALDRSNPAGDSFCIG